MGDRDDCLICCSPIAIVAKGKCGHDVVCGEVRGPTLARRRRHRRRGRCRRTTQQRQQRDRLVTTASLPRSLPRSLPPFSPQCVVRSRYLHDEIRCPVCKDEQKWVAMSSPGFAPDKVAAPDAATLRSAPLGLIFTDENAKVRYATECAGHDTTVDTARPLADTRWHSTWHTTGCFCDLLV